MSYGYCAFVCVENDLLHNSTFRQTGVALMLTFLGTNQHLTGD